MMWPFANRRFIYETTSEMERKDTVYTNKSCAQTFAGSDLGIQKKGHVLARFCWENV